MTAHGHGVNVDGLIAQGTGRRSADPGDSSLTSMSTEMSLLGFVWKEVASIVSSQMLDIWRTGDLKCVFEN